LKRISASVPGQRLAKTLHAQGVPQDSVNSEFVVEVKVFGGGIRVLWDIGKQFSGLQEKEAFEEHDGSEIHEVSGYR